MKFFAKLKEAYAGAGKIARSVLDAVTGKGPVAEAVTNIEQAVSHSLIDAVTQVLIPAMQKKLADNDSIFRSDLHDSFVARMVGNNSVEVSSTVDYAQFVEEGSGPRTIDNEELDNLVEWAEFKFPEQSDPENIALKVAEAIESSGNKPHPYANPALDETRDTMYNMVARQFAIDVRLN